MTERTKIQLSISNRAADVLNKHASERKRGEFISQLLETYEMSGVSSTDIETVNLQVIGLASQLKGHDSKILQIERQIAALMARG
ncbi:MAG: hypothetical protein R3A44_10390 [Caldilineaceae bacterium]